MTDDYTMHILTHSQKHSMMEETRKEIAAMPGGDMKANAEAAWLLRAKMYWKQNPTGRPDIERANIKLLDAPPESFTHTKQMDFPWDDKCASYDPEKLEEMVMLPAWHVLLGNVHKDPTFPSNVIGYTDKIIPCSYGKMRVMTIYADGDPLPSLPEPA